MSGDCWDCPTCSSAREALSRQAQPALTWRDVAKALPEFVQWAAQRHGGLPDGPIRQADYERLVAEYEER